MKQAVKLILFTHWVWLYPPIQNMDFYMPIFKLFLLSISRNSAHIGSAFDFPFIINMLLFHLLQEHQCLVYFLIGNVLISSLSSEDKIPVPHCWGCYNRKSVSTISQWQQSFDWKSKSWETLNSDSHSCFIHIFVIFNTNELSDFNHLMGCSYKKNQFCNKKYSRLQLMNIEEVCSLSLYSLPSFEGLNQCCYIPLLS